MLLPVFSTLGENIVSADLKAADEEYEALINACTSCHIATKYEFIKIQRNNTNPYLQSFN